MNNYFKTGLLTIALIGGSFVAQAQKGKSFDDRKAHMLAEIDERMTQMQKHKDCVSAATDKASMMKCHADMKNWHKEHKMDDKIGASSSAASM